VRALVLHQPDRSLRADGGGAPVLVSDGGLKAAGLVQPLSRVEYRYRIRIDQPPAVWRDAFVAAFPASDAEVRTADDRSNRDAQVLDPIGSGLMLVGFCVLFIGGLGVFDSVQARLHRKLGTLATLRALGLRDARLAALVLPQALILAPATSVVGALLGGLLFGWRMALGGLQRPGSPLRASLLSLGSALTLLAACTLVVAVLLGTVGETAPLVQGRLAAASRGRQVYDASVMHALGARYDSQRRVLCWESTLLAVVTAGIGAVVGSALSLGLAARVPVARRNRLPAALLRAAS